MSDHQRRVCPECGQRLPATASELLCPVCALRHIADEPAEPGLAAGHETARPVSLTGAFGDYELIEEIARGGMGVVYKARQKSLNRLVALKLVLGGPLASTAAQQRFLAEARAAAGLQHPNIIAIHEVGEHEGQPFFSMDHVEGRSLAELVRDGPLPPQRAAGYVKTIAEAVHYAHLKGILHRDLKPSNVLIDQSDQPRVTDFGLAKQLTGDADLTVSGQVLGSPNFMAPEQAQGRHREVGPGSDVYTLGALLYHLLTGRPPFQAATLTEVLRQVATTEPAPPRLLNAGIPRDLETICLKCLEKDGGRRYLTGQGLADELGRFLRGEPILARPVGMAAKSVKWCMRNPLLAGAVGLAAVSLLAGLGGVSWQWHRAESHRIRAEAEALLARRNAYAADMKEVQRALEDSDLGRARELLDRHRPRAKAENGNQKVEIDLRGWEWRYLWSRCQSDDSFTLCRYSNAVSALAFSADGKWLAVQLQGGPVHLWDAVAKQPRTELPFHSSDSGYKALAFSPLANLVAWASQDNGGSPAVTFRDLEGRREPPPCVHPTAIRSIAFSPDAQSLATMDEFGTVRIWDLGSQRGATNFLPAKGEPRNEPISAPLRPHSATRGWAQHYGKVLFSPDGRWLATGEIQGRIRLLDRRIGQEREPLRVRSPGDGITALAFSPDSRLLAAGCGVEDSDVHLWDLDSGTEVQLTGHSGWIASLAFSPDGRTLASASADQTLCLWDVTRKTKRGRFQGNAEEIWALAWSPDGKDLVTGAKDGSVRFWEPEREPEQPYQVLPERIQIWTPAFLPDSKTLLTLTRPEGLVVRWDATTLQAVERLSALGSNHQTMDLSIDGRWLALSDAVGNVRVCNLPERRVVTNFFLPACSIAAVVFSPRGNLLICGAVARDGSVTGKIWSVPGWREISLEGIDLKIADKALVSPDERILAVGYRDGTAAWWNLTTRERRAQFDCHYAGGVQVAFSPEGRWFATGGFDGLLTLWDTATRQARHFGRAYRNELQDVAFSPDGQRLVTSGTSPRGVVKLWDIETGRDLATLPGEFGWFLRVGFSPDGNTVFAASSEGTALLWHAPSFEKIARLENQRAGLKPAESPGARRANAVPTTAGTTR